MTLGPVVADPYDWPFDDRVAGDRLALVVAGWDAGWRARAGTAGDVGPTEAAIARLVATVSPLGAVVITVAHMVLVHPAGPAGAEPPELTPTTGPTTDVGAPGVDGFGGPLDHVLRRAGRTHLLVVGHGLEGPVHSTLRSANDRGYECLLVGDACSPLTPDAASGALHCVTMSGGIFGAVADVAAVVAACSPPRSNPDGGAP